MDQDRNSQFHDGEIAVQKRLGIDRMVAEYSRGFIRPQMPDQHRQFFENLPFVVLGMLDPAGRPWATACFGVQGFVKSPDPHTLTIRSVPLLAEILALDLSPGAKIGMIGIELQTRRRNRMNGILKAASIDGGLQIHVEQSFGNCPQYIQVRALAWRDWRGVERQFMKSERASAGAKALIEKADTFFIVSRTKELSGDTRTGIDASHRGGRPGFVRVNDQGILSFPDFSGNRFFNTLGNIQSDGRVGLFFPDFETGDAVFVTGRAEIVWDEERIAAFAGAERLIDVTIDEIVHAEGAVAIEGKLIEPWPVLEKTGIWSESALRNPDRDSLDAHPAKDDRPAPDDGYRRFLIREKRKESATVSSFYLEPADRGEVCDYKPGQFLPVKFRDKRPGVSIMRSYTLSQAANGAQYRLSVKREEEGVASRILHDELEAGAWIEVGRPAGDFVLQDNTQPVVMLSAGIGITPMLAMLDSLVRHVEAGGAPRAVWFVHGARNGKEQAFAGYLRDLAQKHFWLRLHICFSAPLEDDIPGETYDDEGHITMERLKDILPFNSRDFYLCGPDGFMRALYAGLRREGVDPSRIHHEFFGAGKLDDFVQEEAVSESPASVSPPKRVSVYFESSNVKADWTPERGSLLELAESKGLNPAQSCRSGLCGSCMVRLVAGKVHYPEKPAIMPQDGYVLACCARPAGDDEVVLEL